MSIAAYLGGKTSELRISEGTLEAVGARTEGPVLSGTDSVEEQRAKAAGRAIRARDRYYGRVEDYDPVLRSHCRF